MGRSDCHPTTIVLLNPTDAHHRLIADQRLLKDSNRYPIIAIAGRATIFHSSSPSATLTNRALLAGPAAMGQFLATRGGLSHQPQKMETECMRTKGVHVCLCAPSARVVGCAATGGVARRAGHLSGTSEVQPMRRVRTKNRLHGVGCGVQ